MCHSCCAPPPTFPRLVRVAADEGRSSDSPARWPPNPTSPLPPAPAAKPARLLEKKLCGPADPSRIVEGLGARLLGRKLSGDGFTGILPVMALACRSDASLIPSWRIETAPRPNSLPPIEENPERMRSSRNAPLKLENLSPRPSGENPSWKRPNSLTPAPE